VIPARTGWVGAARFPAEYFQTEFYRKCMAPVGVHHGLFGAIPFGQTGYFYSIAVARGRAGREFSGREVSRFQGLTMHLRRAMRLHDRLQWARLRQIELVSAWEHSPVGLVLLDALGHVVYFNPVAEGLLRQSTLLAISAGKLAVSNRPELTARLERFIDAAIDTAEGPSAGGGPLRIPELNAGHLSLHVYPFNTGTEWFALGGPPARVMVFLSKENAPSVPSPAGLQLQFGLTPAETRLVVALTDGLSLTEAAERLAISRGTARNRLQAVYDKTGVARRQSALMGLLLRGNA
jgi:DNA-binding CsgD family transcriptional regulator/PAS domain-containing protein